MGDKNDNAAKSGADDKGNAGILPKDTNMTNQTGSKTDQKNDKEKVYEYIGPVSGARGKSLVYPGQRAITPSKMSDADIAKIENTNPELFKKLWEVKS